MFVRRRIKRKEVLLLSIWNSKTAHTAKKVIVLFPPKESLVSDIPAGDGKIGNLFSQCMKVKDKHKTENVIKGDQKFKIVIYY